jgi:general stress protein 26
MSTQDDLSKVRDLIDDIRIGMITNVDRGEGRLVSRPMAVQEIEDDGTLWFFTSETAPKAQQVETDPTVNVAFASRGAWVSLAGRATIVDDRDKIHELWNSSVEAWFPGGPDSPDVGLLRVDPDSAECWDSPGGRLASVAAYAKAKVTGGRPDVGESEVVEL